MFSVIRPAFLLILCNTTLFFQFSLAHPAASAVAISPVARALPLASSSAPLPTYTHLGCYVEAQLTFRALAAKGTTAPVMTLEICRAFCTGYSMFGLEYNRECYCGNSWAYGVPPLAQSPSECHYQCGANTCGGDWRLDVWQIQVQSSSTSKASLKSSQAVTSSKTSLVLTTTTTKTSSSLKVTTSTPKLTTTTSTTRIQPIPTTTSIPQTTTSTSSSSKPAAPTSTSTSTSKLTSKSSTAAPSPTAVSGPRKRGLAYNDASLATQFANVPNSQVSWAYNWYSAPNGNLPASFEFVPMLWSNSTDHTGPWFNNVQKAIASGSGHVIAFNEPDLNTQSNMSPAAAAEAYLKWMQPLAGKVKLGAPAVTNGGSPMGLTWLSEFMGNCTTCTIDFVPFHWYDASWNTGYFKWYIGQVRAVTKLPLWITEFNGSGSQADQVTFMQLVMPWLDSLNFIERYAWFGVFDGLLVQGTGLSDTGRVYANYTSITVDPFFPS